MSLYVILLALVSSTCAVKLTEQMKSKIRGLVESGKTLFSWNIVRHLEVSVFALLLFILYGLRCSLFTQIAVKRKIETTECRQ